tara:strand:+ start:19456 stop:20508 length:1053 start_codon:yes stop_codon:yes gene_type:complete
MTHLWLRAEQRDNESRTGLTPEGAARLIAADIAVTVEESDTRAIAISDYADAGCTIVPEHSWPDAPRDAVIFGLKELPDDGTALPHTHIMFGHAFKGQSAGQILLKRFKAGGGSLLDLEYLTNAEGRRVAAFGYWAGFAGAAVALKCRIAQLRGEICGPLHPYKNAEALKAELTAELAQMDTAQDTALIIGALGRVGTGAGDLCRAMNIPVTGWDMAETAHGGPFPEILAHTYFFNCILAGPTTPAFVRPDAPTAPRTLRVVGDIACDPDSDFNPVQIYDQTTTWAAPALRVHDDPVLDLTAIDNLPSMLPLESSLDFAGQLLPTLRDLPKDSDVWKRARALFQQHVAQV